MIRGKTDKQAEVQRVSRQPVSAALRQGELPEPKAVTAGVIDKATPMHLAERILAEIRQGVCRPHHKILSQRRLAARFGTSPAAVYKAVTHLREKGYVYTRGGSGVYLTEQAVAAEPHPAPDISPMEDILPVTGLRFDSFIHPHVPVFKTMRVSIPLMGNTRQIRMWTRALDGFRREFPFVRLEVDFISKKATANGDVQFICPIDVRTHPGEYLPLNQEIMAKAGLQPARLADGLLDLGRQQPDAPLLALPLLRTTTMLVVNRALTAGLAFADAPFRKPADIFLAGHKLKVQNKGRILGVGMPGCPHGTALYGVTVKETAPGQFDFTRDRMTAFLTEVGPWIQAELLFDDLNVIAQRFVQRHMGFLFHYWHCFPELSEVVPELEPLPIPLCPGGFVCEGAVMGAVLQRAKHREEAMLLLGYLSTEPAQTLLIQEDPHWLSIDRQTLAAQRDKSPFPPGSIRYEFDLRNYYTQMNPMIFYDYWHKMDMDVLKYQTGLLDLKSILLKMERM